MGRGAGGTGPTARRGRPTKQPFDWLKDQLTRVSEWGEEVGPIVPYVHHEYEIHTALKLAALNHAIEVFSPIARMQAERRWKYGRSIYVDLFAGTGATLTPAGDWLAGSPVIAAKAKRPFDRLILAESDPRHFQALKRRVGAVVPPEVAVDYIPGDCNKNLGQILGLLRSDDLVFVCVDPEGMEIDWATLEKIVAAVPASDLFINFTSGVDRVIGAMKKDGSGTKIMERFAGAPGAEILAKLSQGNHDLLELYNQKLGSGLGKPLGGSAPVVTNRGQTVYTLLLRTRVTARGSPYARGYIDLQGRLQSVDAQQAQHALDQIRRGQRSLGP